MIGLAILLLCGLVLLWVCGVALAMWILTHPPRRTYSSAVARGRPGDPSEMGEGARPFERWTFKSRGLALPVWDIPGEAPSGPVLIMTHGWADSRIGGLVRLGAVIPVVSRVLMWDLPGHGEAAGVCRLGTSEVDDLLALVEAVRPARVVLMGWSLGAGLGMAASSRLPDRACVQGIIAEAPYRLAETPASNVLRARGLPASIIVPPAFFLLRLMLGRDLAARRFDRAVMAGKAQRKMLVIHGAGDLVCPIHDGADIAAAAGAEMVKIGGAGHNDLWTQPEFEEECTEAVRRFIRSTSGAA